MEYYVIIRDTYTRVYSIVTCTRSLDIDISYHSTPLPSSTGLLDGVGGHRRGYYHVVKRVISGAGNRPVRQLSI